MAKILIIKMSALGDILHTLPAVTDALKDQPDLIIDWLCEEPFVDIARLHPGVRQVIPHGRLRWKKQRLAMATLKEQWSFYRWLREQNYDLVIDAQGRIKSARVAWLSGAPVVGIDRHCVTDPETRFFYKESYSISASNAIEKIRQLFSQALGYPLTDGIDFGIDIKKLNDCPEQWQNNLIFFHGTTWDSKHWPEEYWVELLLLAKQADKKVLLPWGNAKEQERAHRLVSESGWGEVLPKYSLWELSSIIAYSSGAVGVDTGLMHVAAGIGIPTVSIFGSTSVVLTGAMGEKVTNLQSDYECSPCRLKLCPKVDINCTPPCYSCLPAQNVWAALIDVQGAI
ncbi:MAG: lipopolysaccharide heptosyltransferase I [Oceanospirillaceae bacterium]|nr:lipopolysaccharide heptosyltransferase I [Oceanospirillaceae bacterium]